MRAARGRCGGRDESARGRWGGEMRAARGRCGGRDESARGRWGGR